MKVVHVCAYYAPAFVYGGPVRSLHLLCRAQQACGLDVEVFTTTAAGTERLPAAPGGTLFEGVPVRYFPLSSPVFLLGADRLGPTLTEVMPDTDIVHLHGLFNRTIWHAAARAQAAGKPYVVSPRGMLEPAALAHHRGRKWAAWHLKDRAIVGGAALLHATSSHESRTLVSRHPTAHVVEIPNPVAAPEISDAAADALRASLRVPPTAPVLLSLGRLHRIKRLDLVADAFLDVWRRLPDAHLVIAGPDEHNLRPELEARLAPAHSAVRWLGPIDGEKKQALLRMATALVQCSDSESFGMSVAEAIAAGTPVVVTRTCPWEEIVTWQCGYWVEQSREAIADAVFALMRDRTEARTRGARGRSLLLERMSPERVGRDWTAVYERMACTSHAAA